MKARTLFLLFLVITIAVFAMLNWEVFIAPTELSLGLTTIEAPIGLVMLGLLVLVSILFFAFALSLQMAALLDTRRYTKELQANRELTDKAELSRFTELRNFLEAELNKQSNAQAELKTSLSAKIDQLEQDLRAAVEQSDTTLSAYLGELEDRLERAVQNSGQ
ncbi:MAG: LapA family protein [Pseudomonadota bacterium]